MLGVREGLLYSLLNARERERDPLISAAADLNVLRSRSPRHGEELVVWTDRFMLLAGEENLREVVLFPMNQRAEDLMMGAPSEATPKQLKELHIRLDLPKK